MTEVPPHPPATPTPAATVVLMRDGVADGVETFLMRRPAGSRFAPDAYVFPGGVVDDADDDPYLGANLGGDDVQGAELACPVAYYVAAVRELFEETGILLGRHGDARPLSDHDIAALGEARRALVGGGGFAAVLRGHDLVVAPEGLVYAAHFVSPVDYPRRFDVRFFLARCPEGQTATIHAAEAVAGGWYRPADVLERHQQGTLKLMPPTRVVCARLTGAGDVEGAMHDLGTEPIEPPG
jgi:8-oxo-dGTP pyrophosphatase MutT (NUDIX family)